MYCINNDYAYLLLTWRYEMIHVYECDQFAKKNATAEICNFNDITDKASLNFFIG